MDAKHNIWYSELEFKPKTHNRWLLGRRYGESDRECFRRQRAAEPGEAYNVGSRKRAFNRDIILAIYRAARDLGLTKVTARDLPGMFFRAFGARPGHDLAYAVNSDKLRALGGGWGPEDEQNLQGQMNNIVD